MGRKSVVRVSESGEVVRISRGVRGRQSAEFMQGLGLVNEAELRAPVNPCAGWYSGDVAKYVGHENLRLRVMAGEHRAWMTWLEKSFEGLGLPKGSRRFVEPQDEVMASFFNYELAKNIPHEVAGPQLRLNRLKQFIDLAEERLSSTNVREGVLTSDGERVIDEFYDSLANAGQEMELYGQAIQAALSRRPS